MAGGYHYYLWGVVEETAVAEAEALEDSVAVVAASVALAEEAVEVAVQVEAGKIVMLFFITWYNTQKWLVNSAVSRSPTGFERSLMKRVSLNFFQNYNMAKKTVLGLWLFRSYSLGCSGWKATIQMQKLRSFLH